MAGWHQLAPCQRAMSPVGTLHVNGKYVTLGGPRRGIKHFRPTLIDIRPNYHTSIDQFLHSHLCSSRPISLSLLWLSICLYITYCLPLDYTHTPTHIKPFFLFYFIEETQYFNRFNVVSKSAISKSAQTFKSNHCNCFYC